MSSAEPEASARSGPSSGGRRSVDVPQSQVEAARRPAAAVTRRLHQDPDQTGQESQRCSQQEAEEGRAERGGGTPPAGGGTGGGLLSEGRVRIFQNAF